MASIFGVKKIIKQDVNGESRISLRRLSQRLKNGQDTEQNQNGAPATIQPEPSHNQSKPINREDHKNGQRIQLKNESDLGGYEIIPDQRNQDGRLDDGYETIVNEYEQDQSAQGRIASDPVLAVIIHRTDRIKSKIYIIHPMVKVYVVNAMTGEYAKKSQRMRAVAYINETGPSRTASVDYMLPIMTKPSEFRAQDLPSPSWEELLLFNDDFDHFMSPSNDIMLMFEILDFKTMSAARRDIKVQTSPQSADMPVPDERAGGWHRIAWAFLKLISSNGAFNTGNHLRLQLYKAPAITKLRDERQPEVYHWWKYVPRVKYAGSLFVTVKSVDHPRNVPASSRSMYAVQKELASGPSQHRHCPSSALLQEDGLHSVEATTTEQNQNALHAWSRLPGQPCKVPNKLWLTLPCGRDGCFRLKFSTNGKYLAGAGAELQTNKFPIYVYMFPAGKCQGILYGHVQLVYELYWNSTDLLLSASADSTVRLWDVAHMHCLTVLTHTTFVYCARFHPENDYLIFTGAFDKRIRLWSLKEDYKKPKIVQEFEPHANYVNCICIAADNSFLYSGDGAGTIRIWAPADDRGESWMFLKELKEDRLFGKPINALEIHPDQKRLFIQSRDGCVRSLELRSLALRAHYRGLRNADAHVRGDLTPCGTLYFAGDGDGRAIVWNVKSGMQYAEYDQLSLAQCSMSVTCVSYHPFDHWVAFAIYGLRQPILVYKHDSSVPELHKDEPQEKPLEKKEGPSFDPEYSLAKLLEEHRLLTAVNLPKGKRSSVNWESGCMAKSSSQSIIRGGADSGKGQGAEAAAGKRVTFGDVVHKPSTPTERRRALFAQRDPTQQSTLMEIPLEEAMSQRVSAGNDNAPILESAIPVVKTVHSEPQPQTAALKNKLDASAEVSATSKLVIQQPISEQVVVSPNAVIGQVRARYSYRAQNDDEISFQKGDIIKVVRKDELWWVGYVDPNVIGYFPSNYVTEIEQP